MSQYLILHKVSGSPAFDIAEPIKIGGVEDAWIIPTSGHRAYPYRTWDLEAWGHPFIGNVPEIPADWPDHYQTVDLPAKKGMGMKIDMSKILGNLLPKINRRV